MTTWNPVLLNNAVATASDLIGIEECSNYDEDLLQTLKTTSKSGNLKTNKKKKVKHKGNKLLKEVPISPSIEGSTFLELEKGASVVNMDAWNSFNLPDEIINALNDQNFESPTQIQSLVLPPAIFGKKDILGAAETGSGKTLAFGLPILSGILHLKTMESNVEDLDNVELKPLYALILTPTRELAIQVQNHLKMAAKYTNIKIATLVGGMAVAKQERVLRYGPEIIVATPGRLWELYQSGEEHLQQIDQIRYLVIDETDRMLEKGHFQELHDLLEKINENKVVKRQNFVFSATLTMVHDLPKRLINKIKLKRKRNPKEMNADQKLKKIVDILGMTDPKIIDITGGIGISVTLSECRINCALDEKDFYVYYFLMKYDGRTLIFCNSIGCVKRLSTLLGLLNCKAYPLHSLMQQRQRLKNLDRFKSGGGILIATDVAARGLDIPKIEHVIHYQVPRTSESYVHRSGRTARASNQGLTILLIDPSELRLYLNICKTMNKTQDIPTFPVDNSYLNVIKERVKVARELDALQLKIRKTNSSVGWLEKAAKEMDIILDDNLYHSDDSGESVKIKKLADLKRKQLNSLLEAPIGPSDSGCGKYPFYMKNPLAFGTDPVDLKHDAVSLITKSDKVGKRKRKIPLYQPKKKRTNVKNCELKA